MRIRIVMSPEETAARDAILKKDPDAFTDERYQTLGARIEASMKHGGLLEGVDLYAGEVYLYTLYGEPQ